MRFLKTTGDQLIDCKRFEKLQVLELFVNSDELPKIIPYLASKFTQNLFKRMQIKLTVG